MPALVLHPAQPAARAPVAGLASVLDGLGVIGPPYDAGPGRAYLTGSEFLRHVTLLGCAPELPPAPGGSRPPACVTLWSGPGPSWWVAPQVRPRCPGCGTDLAWRMPGTPHAATGLCRGEPGTRVACGHCGLSEPVESLDWRRRAVVAATLVACHGLHPHEAVPADALLTALADTTHCAWDYAYL